MKRVGPVNIIRNIIPGCFFRSGKSLMAFWIQKGVKIINANTHLQKDSDRGDTRFSKEESLPIIKLPDQKREAKHKKIAAFKELLTKKILQSFYSHS